MTAPGPVTPPRQTYEQFCDEMRRKDDLIAVYEEARDHCPECATSGGWIGADQDDPCCIAAGLAAVRNRIAADVDQLPRSRALNETRWDVVSLTYVHAAIRGEQP